MAAENFIHDISTYLADGNLSDLTLTFGEKSWQVHKAFVCSHSKWFQKAITGNFKENSSGVVTLEDDLEFADAIDCMVSYFYHAGYNTSKYNASEALLHAQVATIADKYDCASLYKLARTSFAKTVNAVESDDWVAIAALIYENTTMELPAHVELRNLVVAAVANRPAVFETILQKNSMEELLRSNADLATDLLLKGLVKLKLVDSIKHIFVCDICHYAHAGSPKCPNVVSPECSNAAFGARFAAETVCPQCKKERGIVSKRYMHMVDLFPAFSCPSCDGVHTIDPGV